MYSIKAAGSRIKMSKMIARVKTMRWSLMTRKRGKTPLLNRESKSCRGSSSNYKIKDKLLSSNFSSSNNSSNKSKSRGNLKHSSNSSRLLNSKFYNSNLKKINKLRRKKKRKTTT